MTFLRTLFIHDRNVCPRRAAVPWLAVIAVFAAMAISSNANADTPALALVDNNTFNTSTTSTLGWEFALTNAMTDITQLGFYDDQGDGLDDAVPVAIWTSAGVQMASATIPAGTAGTLVDGFRYASLGTAVELPAGTYTIGALVTGGSTDYFLADASTLTPAPGVIYEAPRGVAGNSLTFPSGDLYSCDYTNGYFGPNFEISTVPEPRTWLTLALGAAGWLVLKRRSKFVRGG